MDSEKSNDSIEIVGEIPPYTLIFNELITDNRLRLQTRMVLILMLSKPKTWDFSVRGMAKIANVSKDTMSRMIMELEEAGYLKRKLQEHGKNGRFSKGGFLVAKQPIFSEDYKQTPCPNLPYTDQPYTENSPQVNNKQVNNKQTNTDTVIFEEAISTIQRVEAPDEASAVRDAIAYALSQHDFCCQQFAQTERRSPDEDYRGKVGIVAAKSGTIIAIEVDRKTPKEKSIFKLRNFPCDFRVIVLRDAHYPQAIPGIDSVISIQSGGSNNLFLQFWKVYPQKKDRQRAYQAFVRLHVTEEMLQKMIFALEVQKRSRQWRTENGRYIPLASTWLNGRRWEDEPDDNDSYGGGAPLRGEGVTYT